MDHKLKNKGKGGDKGKGGSVLAESVPEGGMDVSPSRAGGSGVASGGRAERGTSQSSEAGSGRSSPWTECAVTCPAEEQAAAPEEELDEATYSVWRLYQGLDPPFLGKDLKTAEVLLDSWESLSSEAFFSEDMFFQVRSIYKLDEVALRMLQVAAFSDKNPEAKALALDMATLVRRDVFCVTEVLLRNVQRAGSHGSMLEKERALRAEAEDRISRLEEELGREKALRAEAESRASQAEKERTTLEAAVGYLRGRTKELDREMGVLRSAGASPSSRPGSRMEVSPSGPRSPPENLSEVIRGVVREEVGALRDEVMRLARPPPPAPTPVTREGEGTWATAVGRRERRTAARAVPPPPPPPPAPSSVRKPETRAAKAVRRSARLRRRRRAELPAVLVTVGEEGGITYAEVMREVESKVDSASLGIGDIRVRPTLSGARLFEIPGQGGREKAEALAKSFAEALQGRGVRVSRPARRAEVRVGGLGDSATATAVAAAMAGAGGCPVADIRVGPIRVTPGGRRSCWASGPDAAIRRVANAGGLKVGLVSARVVLLDTRPLQCYRCLEQGHLGYRCTNPANRAGLCFRCGAPDHKAAGCSAARPRCPLCADLGRPAEHRMGVGCRSDAPTGEASRREQRGGVLPPPDPAPSPGGVTKEVALAPPDPPSAYKRPILSPPEGGDGRCKRVPEAAPPCGVDREDAASKPSGSG